MSLDKVPAIVLPRNRWVSEVVIGCSPGGKQVPQVDIPGQHS